MILILCVNGCAKPPRTIDSFCFWYEPIPLTTHDIDTLSHNALRRIDDLQRAYKNICLNQDNKHE